MLGAQLKSGIDAVLDAVDFESKLEGVTLAVTGEGRIDGQSVRFGKVPVGVAKRCAAKNIPVAAIVGGIGDGAQTALQEQGIELCAGASGDADAAVEAYLRGELVNTGANCDHHEHHGEDHSCEPHECGTCGGCHGPQMSGKNVGKTVRTHYRGTFNDGTQFDSSYDRGEPLEFVCGAGMMIPGFDKAVADMEVGETKQVHLKPEEAYGVRDLRNVFSIEIAQLPGAEDLAVGEQAWLQTVDGRPFSVLVTAKDDKMITLDANHEMAGKELNFTIELVEVK